MKYFLLLFSLLVFFSCSKVDQQLQQPTAKSKPKPFRQFKTPVIDNFGMVLKYEARPFSIPLMMASKNAGKGKGWGKGGNPKNQDNPDTPTIRATYVIMLDFDGHTITNSLSEWYWWHNGISQYSALTETAINTVGARFQEAFLPFDVQITTSEEVFQSYPVANRVKVVFTITNFLPAGGVAFIGSRFWNTDEPVYVFTSMLSYSGKYSAGAGVHEAGHALDLWHQGDYRSGVKVSEYSFGFTIDKAPNMGVDYNDPNYGEWMHLPWILGDWHILSTGYDAHVDEFTYLKQPHVLGVRK